jgi:hypothetical protein
MDAARITGRQFGWLAMRRRTPAIADYDRFVGFCTAALRQSPDDPALRYFDSRFYNRRVDNQTGHLRQAFYAASEFFRQFPSARRIPPSLVQDGRLLVDQWSYLDRWRAFVQRHRRVLLPPGARMETVHRILPRSLGGVVTEGGGASPSFKVVIPLVDRYLQTVGRFPAAAAPVAADVWDDEAGTVDAARRCRFVTSRIIRDSQRSLALKELYGHRCQVCGRRIEVRQGDYYSETHHLQPLGGRHQGPDTKPNMLVLCPWHHAEFDHFLLWVCLKSLALRHRLRKLEATEGRLRMRNGHRVGEEFADYNNTFYRKLSSDDA